MLLSLSIEDWPQAAREDFEERAAILEYGSKCFRQLAEFQAEGMTRNQWISILDDE